MQYLDKYFIKDNYLTRYRTKRIIYKYDKAIDNKLTKYINEIKAINKQLYNYIIIPNISEQYCHINKLTINELIQHYKTYVKETIINKYVNKQVSQKAYINVDKAKQLLIKNDYVLYNIIKFVVINSIFISDKHNDMFAIKLFEYKAFVDKIINEYNNTYCINDDYINTVKSTIKAYDDKHFSIIFTIANMFARINEIMNDKDVCTYSDYITNNSNDNILLLVENSIYKYYGLIVDNIKQYITYSIREYKNTEIIEPYYGMNNVIYQSLSIIYNKAIENTYFYNSINKCFTMFLLSSYINKHEYNKLYDPHISIETTMTFAMYYHFILKLINVDTFAKNSLIKSNGEEFINFIKYLTKDYYETMIFIIESSELKPILSSKAIDIIHDYNKDFEQYRKTYDYTKLDL